MDTQSQAVQERIPFELASGTLEVDRDILEKMKLALLAFFQKPEAEFPASYREVRDYFRPELEASICWIHRDAAGIGGWRLENQDGRLELVRYPPPGNHDMYIFHALLEQQDSVWHVIAFEQERELGPQ